MLTSPKTLHIVLNGVVEDSRVLKCAWSLGNAGWDVLVCASSPFTHSDELSIGYARVIRLPLRPVVNQVTLGRILRKLRHYKRLLESKFLPEKEPLIPNLKRSVHAILPVAMDFRPNVVHAHDYTALPIAGAIVEALTAAGISCSLVYDAHEYVPGVAHLRPPLMHLYSDQERKYSQFASAILSVSEGMSDLLIPHLNISARPEIVANDPLVEGQQPASRNLRQDCGIGSDVPLMVYSGAVAPQRGVATAVDALHLLPNVHLVVIANPSNATVKKLQDTYPELHSRFHVLPYVPNAELVSYLSGADIGLIPIHHRQNHEISLITKFGEYMQARLPIVVSDVKTMSEAVIELGNGEVFVAEDVVSFVTAVKKVLADKGKYQTAYTEEVLAERSWERQAEELLAIYNRISDASPTAREHLPFRISEPVPLESTSTP
ncbi:MAG: glycosyltransferase family 4 protein [Actinomycetes bacterium]